MDQKSTTEAKSIVDEVLEKLVTKSVEIESNSTTIFCQNVIDMILRKALQESSLQTRDFIRTYLNSLVTSSVNRSDETLKVKKLLHKATTSLEVVGDSMVS